VRGHHQEDHVIDDVGVAEARTLFALGTAETAEHVVAAPGAPLRDQAAEVVDHELAPLQTSVKLEAGNRKTHAGHRSRNQIFEDAVHARRFRTEIDADEDRRGDIEGQLLERAEGQEAAAAVAPTLEPARDHWVHALEVLPQRRADEGRLHDLAVLLVLLAVAQQQAVGEDAPHDRRPWLSR
jgi:hypothetical protein